MYGENLKNVFVLDLWVLVRLNNTIVVHDGLWTIFLHIDCIFRFAHI